MRLAMGRVGMTSAALTSGTFEGFIKGADKALVDFYDRTGSKSHICFLTRTLDGWAEQKGELERALRDVRDYGSRVAFATVDATAEQELAHKYVPSGSYPQLLWFTHGEPTQYHRTLRTAKAMTDFVLALDREPMLEVKSQEEAASSFNRAVYGTVPRGSPGYKALEAWTKRRRKELISESNQNQITKGSSELPEFLQL